jgi:hypothetical protein
MHSVPHRQKKIAQWESANPESAARIAEHIANPQKEAEEMKAAAEEYEKQLQAKQQENSHE